MGLLDDFGISQDTLEESEAPSFTVEDDHYEFEVGDYFRKDGTVNYPDRVWIIVEYLIGDTGKKFSEWFTLPVDPDSPTSKERETLGRYKDRMKSLGIPSNKIHSLERDDVVGLTGEFTLLTKNGYQNIRNMVPNTDGQNDFAEKEAAPVKRSPRKAPAKAATPVVEDAEEEEEEEEEAPAPRRKVAATDGRKTNPFA
jgi:hypothetical protein